LKTKQEELVALLDHVFDSAEEPNWVGIILYCDLSDDKDWLLSEFMRLLWLCSEDQAAFDEEIWRITNEAQ
jgi:hypothetical protein